MPKNSYWMIIIMLKSGEIMYLAWPVFISEKYQGMRFLTEAQARRYIEKHPMISKMGAEVIEYGHN